MRTSISRIAAVILALGVLPVAAHASEFDVTFSWVPYSSIPGSVTPSGFITLDLNLASAPAVGGAAFTTSTYASAADWYAAIANFSYTDSAGQTFTKADFTSYTPPTTLVWSDTNDITAPFVPSATGNFLLPSFILSNTVESLSFNTGASTATVVNLSTNSVGSPTAYDSGYWELSSVAPVPLPAGLPLLLSGLGLLGLGRRRAAR